ncbi:MAG: M20 family metallopeptidase [Ectothiorhodospiraceae bacterium]|nr:M20 family metallopeptidase [Ectothiorhodospiraceae bacterium]
MSREATIQRLLDAFDRGDYIDELARRVSYRTESQVPSSAGELHRYLAEEIGPELERMGYVVAIHDNPVPGGGPFLIGRRIEDPALPTVLTYGHGDVVRGLEGHWDEGRDPWTLEIVGERVYGRGVVDNKGQHTVNMRALRAVIETRGRLGFNSVFMMETSEEIGSIGIHEFCRAHADALAGDLLVASDGPRLGRDSPTLWLGTRGALNLELTVDLRAGGHHSGNWGGLLSNPGIILANAIAAIVDRRGHVKAREILPESIPNSVRASLGGVEVDPGEGGPEIDPNWGEPGLTPAERVFAWNTFEVLAFVTGNPDNPVNAIPPKATAHCQIRYTTDRDPSTFVPALRRFLDQQGFPEVEVRAAPGRAAWGATRMDPELPWVRKVAASIERTLGRRPAVIPSLGGSLPNDAFADLLGLVTIYVPHSYPGCSQHAPNEHGLLPLFREGLAMMGGVFWDLGEAA